ncbi:hypothetical protein SASPL_101414 [Salvia splendens]|uniref:Uncharacterized protein n=1 Tax=Salvia splendens TaxID=180675 RepID=A0A8X9ACG4_SALSN|nr:hypothetical protein SASPL_101414 [Salvia splendens]
MSSCSCYCYGPMNLYSVNFVVQSKKAVFVMSRRVGVRASMVESYGSSNFSQRMERAWLISQVRSDH